jgi:LacI family transcriptional regulator
MIVGIDMLLRAAYGRGVLRALQVALARREGWEFRILERTADGYKDLRQIEGIIGFYAEEDRPFLENAKVPVINVSSRMFECPVPVVTDDNIGIGRMAADYFVELGMEAFIYCGRSEHHFAVLREEGFRQRLRENRPNAPLDVFDIPESAVQGNHPDLTERLRAVGDQPTGLFCVHDELALRVSQLAKAAEVDIPHPLAILGADDDDLSVLANGSLLSSIRQDFDRIALTALDALEKWVTTGKRPHALVTVPPLQLIARASTDVLHAADPRMREAMRFIREHACKGIRVEDLRSRLAMSRRVLETRFREAFGHSPYEEILRIRIQAAKRLLLEESEATIPQIAERCGYENSKQFSAIFKKRVGCPPSDFRRSSP